MQPQPAQIKRIAQALNIPATAILGVDYADMQLETYGDLMSLLMVLYNANVIIFDGIRDEKNMLQPETAEIKINPLLRWVFEARAKGKDMPLADISFGITSERIRSDLLRWEKLCCDLAEYTDDSKLSEVEKSVVAEMEATKEVIEMELQRSTIMLDKSDGSAVKISTDFT